MGEVDFVILPLANPSFDREKVDIDEIRRLASHGLDGYQPEDRAVAWLCMLNIYPEDPLEWPMKRSELRESYWAFVKDLGLAEWDTKNIPHQPQVSYYQLKNNVLMGQIHGDLVRTGRTIFFLQPDPIDDGYEPDSADMVMVQFARHVRRLERILYVFATCNAGWGYMQGFNELIIPLYYCFISALPFFNNDMILLEALTFQALQTLITESGLHEFYTTQDNSSIIMHRLEDFNQLLSRHMSDVASIINELNIHPLLYCFRWFNLLFSQEHDLPNIILIWDDLFAHFDQLMDMVFYIGLGHIKQISGQLEKGNYTGTLSALQNMPPNMDLKPIVTFANKCWDEDHKKKSGLKGFLQKKAKK
ncbi:hypothetical protein TRFO_15664 [Tritrichomonas foetus]|uniref:Rab-GAP TBC domain-containing protein n=1 Tax=Tritrichomonas foetus TaxID=1144522 RepID=A0A1J4KT07_9EUKA|nr:hypothetical protein TRFO_15664 [Tritrichomonas foetus]|eukprot:OHT14016.1 hypothetical protein TRFO_15664 [Tritrichomonas foetus]